MKTPEQAARQLAAKPLTKGYIPQALHAYTDEHNNIIYWRIRLRHPGGQKWIRPMYRDEHNQYHLGEPPSLNPQAKLLYSLHLLTQYSQATVLIVEGEYPADVINRHLRKQNENPKKQKLCAITSGSSTSADSAD